jgi:hypothetical protein
MLQGIHGGSGFTFRGLGPGGLEGVFTVCGELFFSHLVESPFEQYLESDNAASFFLLFLYSFNINYLEFSSK